MPDKPTNPFASYSETDQASIRDQLLTQLRSGKLNPAQRTGVLNALTASNPQAAKSNLELATGVPSTFWGIAEGITESANRGLEDLYQGYKSLFQQPETPFEKKLMQYSGSRFPIASPLTPYRIAKSTVQGLGQIPQGAGALWDILRTGRTGMGAAAITEGPRFTSQLIASEIAARGPGAVSKLFPSAVRAGRGMDYVEGQIGSRPMVAGPSQASMIKLLDRMQLTGLKDIPEPITRYLDKLTSRQGISFLEGRHFYTDFNSLIQEEKLPSQYNGPLQKATTELGNELKATATLYDLDHIYNPSLKEFSRIQAWKKRAGGWVPKAIGAAAFSQAGHWLHYPYAAGYWGPAVLGTKLVSPVVKEMTAEVINRGKGPVGGFLGMGGSRIQPGRTAGLPGIPSQRIPRPVTYGATALGSLLNTPRPGAAQPARSPANQPAAADRFSQYRQQLPPEYRSQPVVRLAPEDISRIMDKAAHDTGVDARLLRAMRGRESGGESGAISPKLAMGDMQLMPGTARMFKVKNPFDPRENIPAGASLMRDLLTKYRGNLSLALAAYNSNPAAVDKYGGVPPFKETQTYVQDVLARYRALGGGA